MELERKRKARARALRAARVVSIAATLAMGPAACAQSHTGPGDASTRDAESPRDARMPPLDSGPPDSGRPDSGDPDARVADAGHDAGRCPDDPWTGSCCEPMPEECCTEMGLTWDEAAECCVSCVEGPLVPPSAPV